MTGLESEDNCFDSDAALVFQFSEDDMSVGEGLDREPQKPGSRAAKAWIASRKGIQPDWARGPAPPTLASPPPMTAERANNVGQYVRNAFVHAISWWTRVATKERVPAGLNIAAALKNSQLLRNMVAWFGANPVAAREALAFYTAKRLDQLDRLPTMMALMFVASQVTGMPNWTHAALEAGDIDANLKLLARQAMDSPECSLRAKTYMERRLVELCGDVLQALHGLQDADAQVTEYFACVGVHELDLLKALRQLTAMAARLLLVEHPGTFGEVHAALEAFIDSCSDQPSAVLQEDHHHREVEDSEPLAARLAEHMVSLEERMRAVEDGVKAATALATGAEQIAEAAEAAARKAATKQQQRHHNTAPDTMMAAKASMAM